MIREGHLSTYDLTVTTRAPLFVGTGAIIRKTGYLLNPSNSTVTVLDPEKLLSYVVENDLADKYESFILSGQSNMYRFLTRECNMPKDSLAQLGLYEVSAAGVLDHDHSMKEIHQITRTADHQVYIPGSSIKGALRTALLLGPVSKAVPGPQEHLFRNYQFREGRYTNTLRYANAKDNKSAGETASIFQGIRISDSLPISNEHIALASKADVSTGGDTSSLNVVWECIAPNTELRFKLTLDHSVLDNCFFDGKRGIRVETILQAISDFAAYYREQYESKFIKPEDSKEFDFPYALWLGGNAGYFSKTLTYPYWKERALDEVSRYMMSSFPRHGHKRDKQLQISPHTLSYARCNGSLYPMGLCEVSIT